MQRHPRESAEMAQWLSARTALVEDSGFVPSTHVDQLTTVCNFITSSMSCEPRSHPRGLPTV